MRIRSIPPLRDVSVHGQYTKTMAANISSTPNSQRHRASELRTMNISLEFGSEISQIIKQFQFWETSGKNRFFLGLI